MEIFGQLSVITAPTVEPVTLAELKAAVGVSHTDDDAELYDLIKVAREQAEKYTNRFFMTQTLQRNYDIFPAVTFNLGIWPLQSIDSVKYEDTSSPSTEITLTANTDYYADATTQGGRVSAISGWPAVYSKPLAARIRVTAGYTSAAAVPAAIRRGVILWAAGLYQCPDYLKAAKDILNPYRIF